MYTLNNLTKFTAAAILLGTSLTAQPSNRPASGITRAQADSILQELKQIRQLLGGALGGAPPQAQQQPPAVAPTAKVRIDPAMVLGNKDAPITMVEFTDAQCGFCRQFHATAFAEIRKNLIDSGKVRFVSRDLPLDATSISLRAAETMRCAGDQGLYWELREKIMTSPGRLTEEVLRDHASAAGANQDKLQACIATNKYRDAIQKDIDEAASLNVGGTPTFIIGKTTAEGVEGVTVVGALSYAAFEAKIREVESR